MYKALIRVLAYIYVFFVILHRKLTVMMKKRLAEGVCIGTLVILLAVSLLGQGISQSFSESQVTAALGKNHNTVKNENTMASIEIYNSEVAEGETIVQQTGSDDSIQQESGVDKKSLTVQKKGAAQRKAQKEFLESASTDNLSKNVVISQQETGTQTSNAVVKNAVPLSQVQASYENNGVKPENSGESMLYQYPVEIGFVVNSNYDGIQTAADYILNDVFDTKPERESEEDTGSIEEKVRDENRQIATSIQFQKNVWNVILPTDPIERSLSDGEREAHTIVKKPANISLPKDNEKAVASKDVPQAENKQDELSDMDEGKDRIPDFDDMDALEGQEDITAADEAGQTEENESARSEDMREDHTSDEMSDVAADTDKIEKKVVADAGYFTVKGSMRTGVDAFVGDIVIEAAGVNGYNQVRIGEDGEFGSSVTLTRDAADERITLYFSNGSEVTTGVDFIYSKDTVAPALVFDEEGLGKLQGENKTIYCTNNPRLKILGNDSVEGVQGTGIDKLCYVYGDKLCYMVDCTENTELGLIDEFYGRILMNCSDKAGNMSEVLSKYYLVEQSAPVVSMANDAFCTTPYTLWVDVADTGHIISGIQKVECSINGEAYDISDLTLLESVTIDKGINVPSKYEFSVPFTEEGDYNVIVTVTDNAGNVTVQEQTVTVTKPELVSVFMPQEFTIHIDPQQLLGREQIFSDEITLCNNSEFDVEITVKNIELIVNDAVSDTGIKKDCDIYLVAPDTGEKIPIKKGNNKNIYSYCLPEGLDGDKNNLMFVGTTTEGSDAMWESSDITIRVELAFEKWRGESESH